jgi:hypothetical protein
MSEDESEPTKVILFKRRGAIIGLSLVFDYIYRSDQLKHVSLYDWIVQYERIKLKPNKSNINDDADILDYEWDNESNISIESQISDESLSEEGDILNDDMKFMNEDVDLSFKTPKNVFRFQKNHPLFQSHGMKFKPKHEKYVPNFIGANLPRCDQGDRNYYCLTMLSLFKPWRTGFDLKSDNQTWDEEFNAYNFNERHGTIIKNFNIRYECLYARDDYRAQLKKDANSVIVGSWDENENDEIDIDNTNQKNFNFEFDDIPEDMLNIGEAQKARMRSAAIIKNILHDAGWLDIKMKK